MNESYPWMSGVPVCMPDGNYPLYGRQPPNILRGWDWAVVTCRDCLAMRRPQRPPAPKTTSRADRGPFLIEERP